MHVVHNDDLDSGKLTSDDVENTPVIPKGGALHTDLDAVVRQGGGGR
jgi:hypothetical protein